MKTIIKLLFAVSIILIGTQSTKGASFSYKYEGKKLNYETMTDTTCYVSENTSVSGDIIIPEKVVYKKREYTVTGIGRNAFYICSNLESVTIGNSVTSIDQHAFSLCKNLKSLIIGNSVTSIYPHTFDGCTNLESVTIGNSVTSIDESAFYGFKNLSSVIIGNSVKSIGDKAFKDCIRLESVTIGNSVTSIGEEAFYGCKSLPSVSIPNSVISIGEDAFRDCVSLTSLHIGDSVKSIGNFAFLRCPLTSLTLPSSIEDFGQDVFDSNVYSLIKELTMLGDNIFYNGLFYKIDDSTKEAKVIGTTSSGDIVIESIIPYNNVDYIVTTIGEKAFNNVFMNSIKFPDTLKTIEKEAFDNTGFINISLPEGIKKLGYNAFARCEYLKNVHLPSTLEDVSEDFIFGGCYNLESIEFDSQTTVDRLGKDINNLTRGARLAKIRVNGKKAETLSEIDTPLGVKGKYYWKENAQGSKYIVNEAGKTILPANTWDKVWFEGHIILVKKNGKYGCYSYSGTRIVAPSYDSFIGYTYADSRLLFGNNTSTGGKYYVYSKDGALLASKAFSRSEKYSLASWLKNWVPNLITFE